MVFKFVRHFLIPVVAFTGFVSTGFAAWVFIDQTNVTTDIHGTVAITALDTTLGTITINQGDDYTKESQYYTLVFSQEQTLNEDVGVELHPTIEYTFSNFYEAPSGYAYYISYQTEFVENSIYDRYVQMVDVASSGTNSTGKFQLSTKKLIDDSTKTLIEGTNTYSLSSTLVPSFKWRDNSKPSSEQTYNEFIREVNSSTEVFTIVLVIYLEPIA